MNQTFLLPALDPIVYGIKVGNQYPSKVLQQFFGELSFTAFGENIDDFVKVGHNPDICEMAFNIGSGLVDMNEIAMYYPLQDSPCSHRIKGCGCGLQLV